MNALGNLLVVFAAMGVLGSARADMAVQVPHPGAPGSAGAGAYFDSGVSIQYSFAEIVNLPEFGTQPRVRGGAGVGGAPVQAAHSKPAQHLEENAAGSLLAAFSSVNDEMDDLSAVVVPEEVATPPSASVWNTGAGFLFSTAEIPEPGDWMTLLCGVVVVAFIARRKSGLLAD
ncbi:MAG TPA: hypothetical protein VN664_17235 [Burkholderiales bacterium]|nr:hypothetical protein [Burkholderiales bacterium]